MNTIHQEMEMDLSTTTISLKDQQVYTIINVCVSVNTIQKEMQMDTVMDME